MTYSESSNKRIGESLKPTFENVARLFITETMPSILIEGKKISFNFHFTEEYALHFIENVMNDYIKNVYSKFNKKEILNKLNNPFDNELPTLQITNYQLFFELLRQYYKKDIELFFERTGSDSFYAYEMRNCFEEIWLRATPEDFNNPELFLRRQVQIINDKTFDKYQRETTIGTSQYLEDNVLCVKNSPARTWDECPRQFEIIVYDKEHYQNTKLYNRPHFSLPVVRYGIYEEDGKKVCFIGSVQQKEISSEMIDIYNKLRNSIKLLLPRKSKNANIEPANIISLFVFFNFLLKEGITDIVVPSLYVLDYQYHFKRNATLAESFNKEWPLYSQENSPKYYQEAKEWLEKSLNKEDIISRNKTERFILTFLELFNYYPNMVIKSLPDDGNNNLALEISSINIDDLKGDVLKELFYLIENLKIDARKI